MDLERRSRQGAEHDTKCGQVVHIWHGVPQELTNPKWNAHHGTDGEPAQLLSTVTF